MAPVTIHVQHQPEPFEASVVFLGRDAFFDRPCIKFEQHHDTFEITPVRH